MNLFDPRQNSFYFKKHNLIKVRKNVWLSKQYFYIFAKKFIGKKLSTLYTSFSKNFGSIIKSKRFYYMIAYDFNLSEDNVLISEKISKYENLYIREDYMFEESLQNGLAIISKLTNLTPNILNTEITPEIKNLLLNVKVQDVEATTIENKKINCGIDQNLFDFTIARETILNKENSNINPQHIFQELLILKETIPYYAKNLLNENADNCFYLLKNFDCNSSCTSSLDNLIQEIITAKIEELFFKYGLEINSLENILFFSATPIDDLFVELFIGFTQDFLASEFEIVGERNHSTLEEIGKKWNFTRERVRQIIDTKITAFNEFYLKNFTFKSLDFLFIFTGRKYFFDIITQKERLGYDYDTVAYLLKNLKVKTSTGYLEKFNGFFTSNEHLEKFLEVEKQVLKYYFKESDLLDKINEIRQIIPEFRMTKNSIATYISHTFYLKNGTYVRYNFSFSKSKRADILIEKYFKTGFHCSNYEDIQKINELSLAEFGNLLFEETKKPNIKYFHSVQAIIERSNVQLIERGTYAHVNDTPKINLDLAKKISTYLESKNKPVSYSGILKIFKSELQEFKITNRYLLKGALSHFENQLFKAKRDYILPLGAKETLRSKIKAWLISQTEFFNYEEFEKEFKGVAKSVFTTEISETKNFIYFWNRGYIYFKNFKITDFELKNLKRIVEHSLKKIDKGHCTDEHIFAACKVDMPEFISRFKINLAYDIFSVAKHFFKDNFIFKRPLIGALGTDFLSFDEMVASFVEDKEIIEIIELNKFITPQYSRLKAITVFEIINMLKTQFMPISSNKLIRLDKISFTLKQKDDLKKYLENALVFNPNITLSEIIHDQNFLSKVEINSKPEMNVFILAGIIICFFENEFELVMKAESFNRGLFGIKKRGN